MKNSKSDFSFNYGCQLGFNKHIVDVGKLEVDIDWTIVNKADTTKNEVKKVDTSKSVPVYCPSDYSDIDFSDFPFDE